MPTEESNSGLSRPLALHAGNLEPNIAEMDLYNFFSEVSLSVQSLRIIRDETTKAARYAYVNFLSPEDAEKALSTLNYQPFKGREILLSRSIPPSQRNPAANLFISNLPKNTGSEQLAKAFAQYGQLISARVGFSPKDGSRHSYGYVQFETAEGANAALDAVKAGPVQIDGISATVNAAVFKPASERPRLATNVFIRNFPVSMGKEGFETLVKQYGTVTSVFFKDDCLNLLKTGPSDTGFGFANYEKHDEAQAAIVALGQVQLSNFKIEAFPAMSREERLRQVANNSRAFNLNKSNIYIKHIPQTQTPEEIEAFFKGVGEVISFKLVTNEVGARTGVAYCQYRLPQDAHNAIQQAMQRQWYAAIHQSREQRHAFAQRRRYPYDDHRGMHPRYNNGRRYQQPYPYDHAHGMYQQQPRYYPHTRGYQPNTRMYQGHPNGQRVNRRRYPQNQRRRNNPQQQHQQPTDDQRQKLGEELFYKVQEIDTTNQTPKITGMLLDMKIAEVTEILKNPQLLAEKVKEAQEILKTTQ